MNIKPQIVGLPAYVPGKPIEDVKRELGLEKVIKLASNENPFGASPKVAEAIREAASKTAIYPDGYATDLRIRVAQHVGVQPNQLIFGNGSDEVIQILCRAYLTPDSNTVTAFPTFSQYKLNATIEGAEIREVPLKNGVHDLEAMLHAIDEKTKIVWVCNPNNPSGTYVNEGQFHSFMKRVPKGVLVVSDEAYYEYTTADDYPETIEMLDSYDNLVILRTFSKAYGLAALRVGYGIASEEIIRLIEPIRPPFNNTTFAHVAAIAGLEDQAFIQHSIEKNKQGIAQFEAFCEEHKLYYYPTQANFLLIDLKRPSDEVFDYLLTKGYIVRSGRALGFPSCIRITIGSQEENEGIIAALTQLLKESPVPQM
ncbi:histidinol-phosphate transaminase [Halalkalibacterium ligniniphilum]|uniref:histidinol-phosphate transaminase n=1 Tax=Halalkalibacterium ligniniphilum TaxID=1134413 RepID=UPI00034741F4|nr:histidinol-phosphate transaminase [Halalkalibacterium ligniniphilum]